MHKNKPNYRQILQGVEDAGSVSAYAKALGHKRKTVCDWHKAALKKQKNVKANSEKGVFESKTYVITSAQIGTDVHEGFLKNLERLVEEHDAELLIPGITYNANSDWSGGLGDEKKKVQAFHYAKKIQKYLMNDRIKLNQRVEVLGTMNILPTTVNPLNGFATYTGELSAIFPHPKIALESVPTRPGKNAKMLRTTGSVTVPNFIQKNAGIKAEFHHVLGAVIVEVINEKQFHWRHVEATPDGSFYDLTDYYSEGLVSSGHRVDSIVWGDIHHATIDPVLENASWGSGGLMETLKPRNQFFHDLLDFKARNHHNRDNPMFMKKNANASVKDEVRACAVFLAVSKEKWCKSYVVHSNHDDAFDRWVNEVSHFEEPNLENAAYLLEMQLYKHTAMLRSPDAPGIFDWQCNKMMDKRLGDTTFLKQDESLVVNGVEHGMHGHIGLNGAKASPKSFMKIGIKVSSGHTHSCAINEGVYISGHSCDPNQGYNKGPSSWSQTHTIQYANGKRTLLTCINGAFYGRPVPGALL